MTHQFLVDKAFEWAKGRHDIVLKERVAGWGEIPDVLGISLSVSTLIECKISKSDFYHDKKKLSRLATEGMMGNYWLYCCPKGLLYDEDLPEGWGLLEVYPSGYIKLKKNIYDGYTNNWEKYHHPMSLNGYKGERHTLVTAIRDFWVDDWNKGKIWFSSQPLENKLVK